MNSYKNKEQIEKYLKLLKEKGFESKLFLKELLSNGNKALTNKQKCEDKESDIDPVLEVYFEPSDNSITIFDTGIGMTKEELDDYVQKYSANKIEKVLEDNNLSEKEIGLYFLFLIAEKLSIITKKHNNDTAHKFTSDLDTFQIAPCINEDFSCTVVYIKLKDEFAKDLTNKETLNSYLNELKELVNFDLYLTYYDENFQEQSEKIN